MEKNHIKSLMNFWDKLVQKELEREEINPRKKVHTDLLWLEINRNINSPELTILDAGAGFGRFSIPLAQRGHNVIHLDISYEMIKTAKHYAQLKKINNIAFIQSSVDDLNFIKDNFFDLVLALDSPISFCYKTYERAILELIRVTKNKLIICVMNRLGVIAEDGLSFDLTNFGELKTILQVFSTGNFELTDELKKLNENLFPSWHAFTPDEIEELLTKNGCRIENISAPGSLARFVQPELLLKIFEDKKKYKSYLKFEEEFDSNKYILGLGGEGAGGLLVTATKI